MENTWNYKLIDLLKNARLGSKDELNKFIKTHSPLAVVNNDFSVLLLFRHFKVQYWNDERRVLNCSPNDENFQKGITIVTSSDDGGSQSNVNLPNNLNYKELKIKDREIEILTEESSIKTNVTELFRKLLFWTKFTEQDIENGFNNLCNEQYEKPQKPKVECTTIKISSLGELTYNEKLERYEGIFEIENQNIEVSIHNAKPDDFEKLISFVDKQIKSKFYKQILFEMEDKMIELKNNVWLGEDEETGESEPKITADEFRKRISISSIIFYSDCSSFIYCDDNDIFWGHSIEIRVDKNGKYKNVNLAG